MSEYDTIMGTLKRRLSILTLVGIAGLANVAYGFFSGRMSNEEAVLTAFAHFGLVVAGGLACTFAADQQVCRGGWRDLAALDSLLDGEKSGRELRDAMADRGVRLRLAPFYSLIARMEEAGHVAHCFRSVPAGELIVRERVYRITAAGDAARRAAIDPYAEPRGQETPDA